jgi:hypothetical protein
VDNPIVVELDRKVGVHEVPSQQFRTNGLLQHYSAISLEISKQSGDLSGDNEGTGRPTTALR